MKRFVWFLLAMAFLMVGTALWAEESDHPKMKGGVACKYCGMSREVFSYSSMLIEYDDGTAAGMCSIRCAALELALNMSKRPKAILVGDYNSREPTDAGRATWVIGGTKQGVMTNRAKWAFAKKEDAEKFRKGFGGRIASFDQALQAAYQDLGADVVTALKEKKMKRPTTPEKEE